MSFTFSRMRQTFLLLATVAFSLLSGNAKASHLAAADLSVQYVGSGPNDLKYYVVLSLFKACELGSIDLTPTDGNVTIQSSCGFLGTLQFPQLTIDTLDQLCDSFSAINSCRVPGSQWPAFERRVYADTIVLPTACTDWRFSWQLGSRNAGIVNLAGPSGYDIYIEAGLNNVLKYNNSTAKFLEAPLPYICVNQPALYLNNPVDIDGDSLSIVNWNPMGGPAIPGNYIPYAAGYSLVNPIQSSTPYQVDPNTGLATFLPTSVGKYVIAFRCYDLDKITGDTLGYIMRDVQISVLSCAAPPPAIDTIPVSTNQCAFVPNPPFGGYIITCPGSTMTFDVAATSKSISNSVFLFATNNLSIPASTFTVAQQGLPTTTGTFTWSPTAADIGDHNFILIARDSTCTASQPIVLNSYYQFTIRVIPGISAGPDGKICGLNGEPWQLNASPALIPYTWTDINGGPAIGLDNPNVYNPKAYAQYPPKDMTYIVTASTLPANSGCKVKDTVTVVIDTANSVTAIPGEILLCRPGYVQLDATPHGGKPTARLSCGVSSFTPCLYPDSAEIKTFYSGGVTVVSDTSSPFSGARRTARTQYLLTRDDLYAFGLKMGTINSLSFDVNTATATTFNDFSISLKCTDRPELSQATGGFEPGTIPVYTSSGPLTVTPGWNKFNFSQLYDWDSTKGLIVEICYSNPANGTSASINAVATNSFQTYTNYSTVGSGNICLNPTIANTQKQYLQRPIIKFHYCPAPETEFAYEWAPGNFLSDSTSKSPLLYVAETGKYAVYTMGRNGCRVSDTVTVTLPVHYYDVWPKDTSICAGQSYQMEASAEGSNIEWFFADPVPIAPTYVPATTDILSCLNCANPIAKPEKSGRYIAVFTDASQCKDTVEVEVEVRPLPEVYILNRDTTIKYGQSIELQVAGAYIYNWAPVSTLSNPNIVNPLATPSEPLTYTVIGLADNGCRNVDSVRINIDYRDNLFVPSAFTPNGDGKNDIFKVTNITFQKLQEFRVFNRWGQEIFRTNDAATGWDGTWRGVAQDMGSYQYLIRVAYPDGYIETYKGDVTLIR